MGTGPWAGENEWSCHGLLPLARGLAPTPPRPTTQPTPPCRAPNRLQPSAFWRQLPPPPPHWHAAPGPPTLQIQAPSQSPPCMCSYASALPPPAAPQAGTLLHVPLAVPLAVLAASVQDSVYCRRDRCQELMAGGGGRGEEEEGTVPGLVAREEGAAAQASLKPLASPPKTGGAPLWLSRDTLPPPQEQILPPAIIV